VYFIVVAVILFLRRRCRRLVMSSRTLPLLYLNLGGEMMYVLDQRLVAQKVPGAKAAKGGEKHLPMMQTHKMSDKHDLKKAVCFTK
jgi:hypothetical protein